MPFIPENFCTYTLNITLSGVWVLIRERGKARDTEVKMKLFIPYERMLEDFPDYGKPRQDYLLSLKTGKLFRAKGFIYEYGEGSYLFGKEEYRKIERWEWDYHTSIQRSPENSNAKFFKMVQDAYTSHFGE